MATEEERQSVLADPQMMETARHIYNDFPIIGISVEDIAVAWESYSSKHHSCCMPTDYDRIREVFSKFIQ